MEKRKNRLQYETSPYLLQHAENPVEWYPWCDEAFIRAKKEDKPVFLSIGYSTCHWCHVMAHESFEDEDIAELLNRYFICIKVDKEERPDIDSIYMSVCQAFTGSGGWPTSIFMTPEQLPFFAGTYFPKRSRRGIAGFYELLTAIRNKWETDREDLLERADVVMLHLSREQKTARGTDDSLTDAAVSMFIRAYDRDNGGFGTAPKFPTPHNLLFLLSCYRRYRDEKCLHMAEHTLMQIYRGGLFDHIGGGFSRYSTDEMFLVPHFEKMLYDNAMLMLAYCEAHFATKDNEMAELYLKIAERTAEYILREMTSPEGGFYSAQDADSEGEEGRYYVFAPEEIRKILGEKDGESFCRHFDITRHGNFEGKNIPNLLNSDPFDASFDENYPKLYQYRKDRYGLHMDKKILTAWNSLMIAAICALYRASGKKQYLYAAQNADRFIEEKLWDGQSLYVSFAGDRRGTNGFLDDYAAYCFAKLALYRATLKAEYLHSAEKLCEKVLKDFSDNACGGFYFSGRDNEKLILRPKEAYDGAMPSGNSLMAWNLVKLYQLTGNDEYKVRAQSQLDYLSSEAASYPIGHSMFLRALVEFTDPPVSVKVVSNNRERLDELIFRLPFDADITLNPPSEKYPLKDGEMTFYICDERGCHAPVNDPGEVLG